MVWFHHKIRDFFRGRGMRNGLKVLFCAAVAFAIAFFILVELASRGIAFIFNQQMAKQDMLRGTVTVEQVYMDLLGHVKFVGLVWKDTNGETILEAPDGSFKLRLWDVVTRNFKSTTVQQLTLNRARVAVRFTRDMDVDFVRIKDPDEASGPKKKKERKTFEQRVRNFNRDNRKIRANVVLDDCEVEVRYLRRDYVLNNVNLEMDIDTADKTKLTLTCGEFGGTMVGGGMTIDGIVDFAPEIPEMDIDFAVRGVDPSSLGFGMNIHDKMTLVAKALGPVTRPTATGTVRMDELNIPPMEFRNVIGDISYQSGEVTFTNVTANVFNGALKARGWYDVDTRKYKIYGHGTDLDTRIALKDINFYCLVALDMALECDGNPRNTLTYGIFKSGTGRHSVVPFEYLSGRFSNQHRKLDFYDVVIAMPLGQVKTDVLRIHNGKMMLDYVTLVDPTTGRKSEVVRRDMQEGNPAGIRENIERIRKSLKYMKGEA